MLAAQEPLVRWDWLGSHLDVLGERAVEHLGLTSFALVAQAAGGFGALEFALANPSKVSALVIANSIGGITDPTGATLPSSIQPGGILP